MKKWNSATHLALAVTLAYGCGSVATSVMPMAAKRNLEANLITSLPDGLHLALCGAGGPLPDPIRSGPCVAVIAGRSLFIVDAGSGGARNLMRMHVPPGSISSVLLTHFHSDHIDGLGELGMLRWVGGSNKKRLVVMGPPGVEQVVEGFNQAYRMDAAYRTEHHGTDVAAPDGAGLEARAFTLPEGASAIVWDAEGVRITAFTVDHKPALPAVGYRFEYKGRSLVISGDTRKNLNVEQHAKDADLLVHEALAANLVAILNRAAADTGFKNVERITHDIPDYHTTPQEAAQIASAANVQALLYYHVVPPLPLRGLDAAFLEGVRKIYDGKVEIGKDGTLVSMPSGTQKVLFSDLF